MVIARLELDDYTNRVLNVLKAKFDLNDKSEALNRFAEMYGDDLVEKEANEEYVKKIIKICDEHRNKHHKRRMSIKELDKLCEVS